MSYLDYDTDEIDVVTVIDEGVQACRRGDWEIGVKLLWKAARQLGEDSPDLPPRYYTYLGYGIARTERRLAEGMRLCAHGVKLDRGDPDGWLNLARIYMQWGHRRKLIKAIEKGLAVSPTNRGLLELRKQVGERRPPVFAFLPRSHRINRWFGERRHERELLKSAKQREQEPN